MKALNHKDLAKPLTFNWVVMGYFVLYNLWGTMTEASKNEGVSFNNGDKINVSFREWLSSSWHLFGNNKDFLDMIDTLARWLLMPEFMLNILNALRGHDDKLLIRSYLVGYLLKHKQWANFKYNVYKETGQLVSPELLKTWEYRVYKTIRPNIYLIEAFPWSAAGMPDIVFPYGFWETMNMRMRDSWGTFYDSLKPEPTKVKW